MVDHAYLKTLEITQRGLSLDPASNGGIKFSHVFVEASWWLAQRLEQVDTAG